MTSDDPTRDETTPADELTGPDAVPVHQITQAAALAAFANPARARLMDALTVDGPSTASMLATRVGMAVGSASHHLKVLAEAGLVEEAPDVTTDRRQRYWRLAHRHTRWSRREMTDPSAQAAAYEAELVGLQRQFERTRDAILASEGDLESDSGAFATQQWLRLTPDELSALSQEIVDVLYRWQHRDIPDDGMERETCLVFARGFPAQP